MNKTNIFDDDSVSVEVLTRVSGSNQGTFTLSSELTNTQSKASLYSLPSVTVSASTGTVSSDTPTDVKFFSILIMILII